MKFDSVLFDLDGTLWDSSIPVALSWEKALAGEPDIQRIPTREDLAGVMGLSAGPLTEKLFPYLEEKRRLALFDLCCQVETEYLRECGATLYEGLEETLALLAKDVPLFIISNCSDGYIESFLESHHMYPYFKDWECIGRTGKPKWENIRLIIERNGLTAPVYVGDTVMDKDASEKADIPFIYAAYGFGRFPYSPSISSPRQLPDHL